MPGCAHGHDDICHRSPRPLRSAGRASHRTEDPEFLLLTLLRGAPVWCRTSAGVLSKAESGFAQFGRPSAWNIDPWRSSIEPWHSPADPWRTRVDRMRSSLDSSLSAETIGANRRSAGSSTRNTFARNVTFDGREPAHWRICAGSSRKGLRKLPMIHRPSDSRFVRSLAFRSLR